MVKSHCRAYSASTPSAYHHPNEGGRVHDHAGDNESFSGYDWFEQCHSRADSHLNSIPRSATEVSPTFEGARSRFSNTPTFTCWRKSKASSIILSSSHLPCTHSTLLVPARTSLTVRTVN